MEKDEKTEKTKKEKTAPPVRAPPKVEKMEEGFRGIVRIAGKDVQGKVPLARALLRVRGIGSTMGKAMAAVIHRELGIDPAAPMGRMTDEQVEKIDAILFHLSDYKLPTYLYNRAADPIEGTPKHAIMNDLLFAWKQDIEKEKKLYTWRGYRHGYGQKVRGQRTRNTGRTGMAVGVLRKAVIAAQKAATAPDARGGAGKPGAAAPAAGAPAPAAGAKPAAAPTATAKPAAKKPEGK